MAFNLDELELLDGNSFEQEEKDIKEEEKKDDNIDDIDNKESEENEDESNNSEIQEDDEAVGAFNVIKKIGLFDDEDEKLFSKAKSWDKLDELVSTLPHKVVSSVIETAPQQFQQLLKLVYNEGENLSNDKLKDIFEAYQADNENKITEFNSDTARDYLEKVYSESGMRPKAIASQLDDLEDNDELVKEAKKQYEKNMSSKLAEVENKIQNEKLEQTKQAEERQKALESTIESFGWKDTRKKAVKSTLANFNNLATQVMKNPASLVELADFLSYYDSKTGKFDLSNYAKMFSNDAIKQTKESITRDSFGNKIKSTKANNYGSSNFNIDEYEPVKPI